MDKASPRLVFAVGLVVVAAIMLTWSAIRTFSGREPVDYPYWCDQCHEVFPLAELNADNAKNWKIAPGGGSDSVVVCLRCQEGKAYPAIPCRECGTHHLLHIHNDMRCPVCHPEVAEAAKKKGIDLTPDGIN